MRMQYFQRSWRPASSPRRRWRVADEVTIVDKVVELSGASGFDTTSGDFDILREAVIAPAWTTS